MSGVKVSKALRIGAAGEQPVTSIVNPVTGGITKIWTGTQAQYDALTPADDTLYIIVEA